MGVARVLTDVAGIDKEFDYLIPPSMEGELAVGDQVRIGLGPRRVGGWVLSLTGGDGRGAETGGGSDAPAPGTVRTLKPVAKRRGRGPESHLLDLAGWAAGRWVTRRAVFLAAASSERAVVRLPPAGVRPPAPPPRSALVDRLPSGAGTHVLRLPPAGDPTPIVAGAAQRGAVLVVVPTHARAEVLAGRLRRAGGDVALLPAQWDRARAGAAVVIGTRTAAWGPCPGMTAVVVLDAHDEGLTQEGAPTWSAVAVAVERARRAGVPCLLVSACPTLELLALGDLHRVEPAEERRGWATFEVLDRRGDDPRLGLYSDRLVRLVRDAGGHRRVACILNRTGRVRLLACSACGELARCEPCGASMASPEPGVLQCRNGHRRPAVCARCDSLRLRSLRLGVSRARADLEALAGRPVGEVTGATTDLPETEVLVGTEALLHRLDPASGVVAVAFVDFDQELLAPRMRAADEALALLAHASRLVRGSGGRVLVQTRLPDHPVVQAARAAAPERATDAQLPVRRSLALPPFTALALVYGDAAAPYIEALQAGNDGGREPALHISGPDGGRWLVKSPSVEWLSASLAGTERPANGTVRIAVEPARL